MFDRTESVEVLVQFFVWQFRYNDSAWIVDQSLQNRLTMEAETKTEPKRLSLDEKLKVAYCIPDWLKVEQIKANTRNVKGLSAEPPQ